MLKGKIFTLPGSWAASPIVGCGFVRDKMTLNNGKYYIFGKITSNHRKMPLNYIKFTGKYPKIDKIE